MVLHHFKAFQSNFLSFPLDAAIISLENWGQFKMHSKTVHCSSIKLGNYFVFHCGKRQKMYPHVHNYSFHPHQRTGFQQKHHMTQLSSLYLLYNSILKKIFCKTGTHSDKVERTIAHCEMGLVLFDIWGLCCCSKNVFIEFQFLIL